MCCSNTLELDPHTRSLTMSVSSGSGASSRPVRQPPATPGGKRNDRPEHKKSAASAAASAITPHKRKAGEPIGGQARVRRVGDGDTSGNSGPMHHINLHPATQRAAPHVSHRLKKVITGFVVVNKHGEEVENGNRDGKLCVKCTCWLENGATFNNGTTWFDAYFEVADPAGLFDAEFSAGKYGPDDIALMMTPRMKQVATFAANTCGLELGPFCAKLNKVVCGLRGQITHYCAVSLVGLVVALWEFFCHQTDFGMLSKVFTKKTGFLTENTPRAANNLTLLVLVAMLTVRKDVENLAHVFSDASKAKCEPADLPAMLRARQATNILDDGVVIAMVRQALQKTTD